MEKITAETRICPLCQRELDHSLSLEPKDIITLHAETGVSTAYTVLVRSARKQVPDLIVLTEQELQVLQERLEKTSLETQSWVTENTTSDPTVEQLSDLRESPRSVTPEMGA